MASELPRPPEHPQRLVYFGTPEAAVEPLRALHGAGFEIPLVVSRADRKRGRRAEPTPSPVKAAALALGIEVTTSIDDALGVGADCAVVVAFGRIIPEATLQQLPMLNVHFSLLPRWRGAAPVERAILAGDEHTGVCLMGLEVGLDTGPVYDQVSTPIGPDETAEGLRARLVEMGSAQLVRCLREGLGTPVPQQGEPTYAAKITRDDRHLDWTWPAAQLARIVRVGSAWTTFRGRNFKVIEARVDPAKLTPGRIDGVLVGTGDGALELITVQTEGKAPVPAAAWRNGARLTPDDRLGDG